MGIIHGHGWFKVAGWERRENDKTPDRLASLIFGKMQVFQMMNALNAKRFR
jgi:hypothetical protein